MMPETVDAPADAIVWTWLFSRMLLERNARSTPSAIADAGIDAATVMPTRRPRYAFAAAINIASTTPSTTALTVISGRLRSGPTRGRCGAVGFIRLFPSGLGREWAGESAFAGPDSRLAVRQRATFLPGSGWNDRDELLSSLDRAAALARLAARRAGRTRARRRAAPVAPGRDGER